MRVCQWSGNTFAPYLLTGFDDLISLTFGRPSDDSIYFTFDNIAVGPSVVPEPATWTLLVGGFGLVGHRMRRRRARVARA